MKIGVFDSGIGGERIAKLLQIEFNDIEIINVSDKENLPYGNKTKKQLLDLVKPKLKKLELESCDAIVIACNTVTTNIVKEIRDYISVPIIGFEPMIKTASEKTKTNSITICATKATLSSDRYSNLKNTYGGGLKIFEPDCSEWAGLIEKNTMNKTLIDSMINQSLGYNSDVIVLGCTHYHWIEQDIAKGLEGRAIVIQPEEAIIKRLKSIFNL